MSIVSGTAHPVLVNLLKLVKTYGPIILQWLITSGIIKLPPNIVIPPLPTGGASIDPSQYPDCEVEVDSVELEKYRELFSQFHSEVVDAA